MLKEYETVVEKICGENWKGEGRQTRQAAYGIAIMLAYINGVELTLNSMSDHLDIDLSSLRHSFARLQQSGIFIDVVNIKSDKPLLGCGYSDTGVRIDDFSSEEASRNAWCHVAGIASGAINRNFHLLS
ncbi:MAG: hypothetical protein ACOC5T_06465 [Elusimicrobiota bacterium]